MIPEALVIFACASNHGCSETVSLYSSQHPDLAKNVEQGTRQLIKAVGPTTVSTLSPIVLYFSGGTSNIKLYESFYLQLSRQQGLIMIKKEFK